MRDLVRSALLRHAVSVTPYPSRSIRRASSNLDDRPPADLALQHAAKVARQVVERNRVRDIGEVTRLQAGGKALPYLAPQGHRGVLRVDADEPHPAQDERQHRGLQFDAAGVAEARDQAILL